MPRETLLRAATFDPKLKTYWFFHGLFLQAITFVGLIITPLWVLGLGQVFSARAFDKMQAELTDRSLNVRRGVLFPVEKTIPLDKITDVALRGGPILNALGLASLAVETAGGSAQGTAAATLTGVVDAQAFRDAVLAQRDRVTEGRSLPAPGTESGGDTAVLAEIRDSLHRIEQLLAR